MDFKQVGTLGTPIIIAAKNQLPEVNGSYKGIFFKIAYDPSSEEDYPKGTILTVVENSDGTFSWSKSTVLENLTNGITDSSQLLKNIEAFDAEGNKIIGTLESGSSAENKLAQVVDKSITEITAEDLKDVTNIGEYLFYKCDRLTDVTLSSSITNIGNNAFSNCNNLQNVHITDNVTNIGSSAFYKCIGLTNIIIPNNVTDIGSSIFSGCSSLTDVIIGNGITKISSSAFKDCSNLIKVIIGNNVTNIDYSAFSNCSNLTSIVIPNGVTNIGGSAFNNCSKLESVVIPSTVTNIGSDAFYTCRKIKKIYITDVAAWCNISGLSASDLTFYGGSEGGSDKELYLNDELVTSLVIPDGVTLIPSYAFANCWRITSVIIPDSVTNIEERAFRRSGLTNVTIPNGVTNIGRYAFDSCKSLMKIIIPNSVTNIDQGAFQYCSILSNITLLPTTPPTLGSGVFTSISSSAVITVPKGSLNAYQTAENWSTYAAKMVEATE